jgi:predicted nucleic acid-binding protein
VRAEGFFPKEEISEFELDDNNNYRKRNIVVMLDERNVTAKISGKVINERTKKPLPNAEVEVSIGQNTVKVKTDMDGEFVVLEEDLRHGFDYETAINVKANGFFTLENGKEFKLETDNDYRKNDIVIKLKERNASIIVSGQVINNRTKLPVANAVTELDIGEDNEYEIKTDENGR